MSTMRGAVERGGQGALLGWREKVADAVATPVSRRTPLDATIVRAVVGWVFVVLAVVYLVRTARSARAAG